MTQKRQREREQLKRRSNKYFYYEKKELSEHIEEVHVKQEKGNLLNFKVYFHSYCMTGKKTYR